MYIYIYIYIYRERESCYFYLENIENQSTENFMFSKCDEKWPMLLMIVIHEELKNETRNALKMGIITQNERTLIVAYDEKWQI